MEIKNITQTTHNPFVNLYELETVNRVGRPGRYYVASRAKSIETMKISTRENHPDGVIIYSLYGEKQDKVVLVRQYRYPVDTYVYEFPAGLVEPGENYREAAVRELKEETGLTLHPIDAEACYEKPCFTTIGLTDESCATVYGTAEGEVSHAGQEDSEDIEIVLADRAEAKRILEEELVAMNCAYMLMHFIKDASPLDFLK